MWWDHCITAWDFSPLLSLSAKNTDKVMKACCFAIAAPVAHRVQCHLIGANFCGSAACCHCVITSSVHGCSRPSIVSTFRHCITFDCRILLRSLLMAMAPFASLLPFFFAFTTTSDALVVVPQPSPTVGPRPRQFIEITNPLLNTQDDSEPKIMHLLLQQRPARKKEGPAFF